MFDKFNTQVAVYIFVFIANRCVGKTRNDENIFFTIHFLNFSKGTNNFF